MPTFDAIPFAIPDITEAEVQAAAERIRSGWLTTGSATREFESSMVEFLTQPHCGFSSGSAPETAQENLPGLHAIAVNSATAGLHLALEAIGVGPGDEVIVPDWTFTASAEVVRYLGATPILVDIEQATLNLNLDLAAAAITERTKVIIPVHFAGLAANRKAVYELARKHNLYVVEDAAHALPTVSDGQLVGTLLEGERGIVVYSFYATKTITTGEGGMAITRNPEWAERMRAMRLHGISRDVFDRYTSTRPGWQYDVVAPGYKYNLTDIASAIGTVQLRRAWEMRDKRAAIASRYDEAFADLPVQLPAHASDEDIHSWHLYELRLLDDAPIGRDQLINALASENIGTSVHFIPLHKMTYWRESGNWHPEQFPVAEDSFTRALSLPLFSAMTDTQVERVAESVHRLLS